MVVVVAWCVCAAFSHNMRVLVVFAQGFVQTREGRHGASARHGPVLNQRLCFHVIQIALALAAAQHARTHTRPKLAVLYLTHKAPLACSMVFGLGPCQLAASTYVSGSCASSISWQALAKPTLGNVVDTVRQNECTS